jgi:hypothetical protein
MNRYLIEWYVAGATVKAGSAHVFGVTYNEAVTKWEFYTWGKRGIPLDVRVEVIRDE